MMRLLVGPAAISLVVLAACATPGPRLNAPPHGTAEKISDLQGTFVYMHDNALLADMTVSNRHFLPRRALLTNLGEQRLRRLVSLIEAYGGTIRFNSDLEDQELIKKRMAVVVQFLADAGIDTTAEILREDLPGGSGMDAREVILIKVNEATYQPDKQDSGDSAAQTSFRGP